MKNKAVSTKSVTPPMGVSRREIFRWGFEYLYIAVLLVVAALLLWAVGGALLDWLEAPASARSAASLWAGITKAVHELNENSAAMLLLGGLPALAWAVLPEYLTRKVAAKAGLARQNQGYAASTDSGSAGTDMGEPLPGSLQVNAYGHLSPDGLVGIVENPTDGTMY